MNACSHKRTMHRPLLRRHHRAQRRHLHARRPRRHRIHTEVQRASGRADQRQENPDVARNSIERGRGDRRDCGTRRRHHRSRGRLPDHQTRHAAVRHSHGRLGVRQGPDRRSAHRSACARRYGAACVSCAGIPCLLSGATMPTPLEHVAGAVKRDSLHVAGGAFPTAVVKNNVYTYDFLPGTFQAAGNPCQPARLARVGPCGLFPAPAGSPFLRRPPGAVRTGAPMPAARKEGCLASVGNNLDDTGTVSALSPNPNAFRHPAHPPPPPQRTRTQRLHPEYGRPETMRARHASP